MRRREALLLAALATGVLAVAAVLLRGAVAVAAALLVVLVLVGAGVVTSSLRARAWRRMPPDVPPGRAGRLRLRAGGSFTWEPPLGPPRFPTGGDLVRHRWWDADGAPRHYAHVEVEVPDAAVGKPLARATRRALRSASRALPGRGRVRASAAVRDKEGPTSLVRVRLEVQGVGADASWAKAAARAFAERLRRESEKPHVAIGEWRRPAAKSKCAGGCRRQLGRTVRLRGRARRRRRRCRTPRGPSPRRRRPRR